MKMDKSDIIAAKVLYWFLVLFMGFIIRQQYIIISDNDKYHDWAMDDRNEIEEPYRNQLAYYQNMAIQNNLPLYRDKDEFEVVKSPISFYNDKGELVQIFFNGENIVLWDFREGEFVTDWGIEIAPFAQRVGGDGE